MNRVDSESANETKIETLVIFDIEATGLHQDQPKITEFSMVAVNRNELLSPSGKPRIINKLHICVNPLKPIPAIVSQMTGLFNDHLENQQKFDTDLVSLINAFLNRLPKPVCLLAHNGHSYDFPLLKTEIEKVSGTLSDHVRCSDSLIAFRDLGGEEPWESHKPYLSPRTSSCEVQDSISVAMQPAPSSETVQQSPMDMNQGLDPLNIHDNGAIIDENMNVSSAVLLNQNIPVNNNNEHMQDLEALHSIQDNHSEGMGEENNSQDSNMEDESDEENNPEEGEQHSPNIHDEDFNTDPINCRFLNENTPVKRPVSSTWAPRKNIPPRARRNDPGRTRRQLNFDIDESPEIKLRGTPGPKLKPESGAKLGKTKRKLNFDSVEPSINSCLENGDPCNQFQKMNDCESSVKRLCVGEPSHGDQTFNKNNSQELCVDTGDGECHISAPSSFDDESFLYAIENIEKSMLDGDTTKPSGPQSRIHTATNLKASSSGDAAETPKSAKIVKLSYSLFNLYSRVFGRSPNFSHTSEDDCLNLLELIKKHSPEFIYWVDSHNIPFNDSKPMY